ncbi:MAG: sensor histidine kinase [Bacteroidota bacterium]
MKLHRLFTATLRKQLLVSLILLVVSVVATIGITSIKIAQQVIVNHTSRFGGNMLSQAAYRLGSVIDNAETTVDSLILDRRLAPLLHDLSSANHRLNQRARLALGDLLCQYKASLLPGAELILVDSAGNTVTTYTLQPIPSDLVPQNLSTKFKIWRLRYLPYYHTGDSTVSGRLLELTARIISLPGQTQNGWIILHLDYRIVESIMTNITLRERNLSRFQSDAIVFGPSQQVIFPWIAPTDQVLAGAYQKLSTRLRKTETTEETVDGKKYLVIAAPVPWTSWQVYISAPTTQLYAGLEQIYDYIVSIGALCIIVAIFSATFISFLVTKPVDKLCKAMRLVEAGHFDIQAPESGPLEIQTLGRAFNRMLSEVDLLTRRLVAEESSRKTAVIKALQAQIAPHFLFNTLAALAGMTAKRPPGEVAAALRSLKRLLHLSIGKDGDLVTLADEFEHVQHYLYLMNIRFPDKFCLEMELPEELRHCPTIRLILQPIVENCLQHGLKFRGGKIRLTAIRENHRVIIKIADNGEGISPEQLAAIWRMKPNQSGVGIRNVDERLKLSFGPEYGLRIDSSKGGGTTVSVLIPFQEDSKGKSNEPLIEKEHRNVARNSG